MKFTWWVLFATAITISKSHKPLQDHIIYFTFPIKRKLFLHPEVWDHKSRPKFQFHKLFKGSQFTSILLEFHCNCAKEMPLKVHLNMFSIFNNTINMEEESGLKNPDSTHIFLPFLIALVIKFNHIWVSLSESVATKSLWWGPGEHIVLRQLVFIIYIYIYIYIYYIYIYYTYIQYNI